MPKYATHPNYILERERLERARLLEELEVVRAFAREFWPMGHIRTGLKAASNDLKSGELTAEEAAGVISWMLMQCCQIEDIPE